MPVYPREKVMKTIKLLVMCSDCHRIFEYNSDHYPDLFYLGEQWVHRHDCDEIVDIPKHHKKGALQEYRYCFRDYDDPNSELHLKSFVISQTSNVPKCNSCEKHNDGTCKKLVVCPSCGSGRAQYLEVSCDCGCNYIKTGFNAKCPACGRKNEI